LLARWKIAACVLALVAIAPIAYEFGMEAHRKANPEATFSAMTGMPIPPGIRVTQYASTVTDNCWKARRMHFGKSSQVRRLGVLTTTRDG
jgi:hypothetical protein